MENFVWRIFWFRFLYSGTWSTDTSRRLWPTTHTIIISFDKLFFAFCSPTHIAHAARTPKPFLAFRSYFIRILMCKTKLTRGFSSYGQTTEQHPAHIIPTIKLKLFFMRHRATSGKWDGVSGGVCKNCTQKVWKILFGSENKVFSQLVFCSQIPSRSH